VPSPIVSPGKHSRLGVPRAPICAGLGSPSPVSGRGDEIAQPTSTSLGSIPKSDTVKLTITLHVALKADLDRYAELHAQAWGQPIDAAALIPFILDNCITRDRGFRKAAGASA
jgi:hypothetical protein